MFSMMMTHIARDVGKRGTSLGIVIVNIDLMGAEGMNPMMEQTFVVDRDYYQ